jgi:hypothetical protein
MRPNCGVLQAFATRTSRQAQPQQGGAVAHAVATMALDRMAGARQFVQVQVAGKPGRNLGPGFPNRRCCDGHLRYESRHFASSEKLSSPPHAYPDAYGAWPHRHQDKPGRGESICRFRRRLGSARSLCARGSTSRMARRVRPERLPTTASIASLETRQREQRPWDARSSGGRFQEILANVFGQQNQDQMSIQPTQAACVGAGG